MHIDASAGRSVQTRHEGEYEMKFKRLGSGCVVGRGNSIWKNLVDRRSLLQLGRVVVISSSSSYLQAVELRHCDCDSYGFCYVGIFVWQSSVT